MTTEMGTFEGKDILQVRAKLGGSGTGLNEHLAVDPITHHQGEEVCLVVRGRVKVGFEDIKGTDCLARIETVSIREAAFVEESYVSEILDRQAAAVEHAKGVAKLLPGEADKYEAHERGEHTADVYPVDGCTKCNEEEQAKYDEAMADTGDEVGAKRTTKRTSKAATK